MNALNSVLVAQARIPTPLGPMTAAATARGLAGLWFDGQRHHPGALAAPVQADHPHLALARQELAAWFDDPAARSRGFSVPLDLQGTPFQRGVWQLLQAIPCGGLARYGELARRLGRPQAARAVGAAVGRNPVSLVVPCHRVLGQDGSLTGYAGGLPRKQALLALEGAPDVPPASSTSSAPRSRNRERGPVAAAGVAATAATAAPTA